MKVRLTRKNQMHYFEGKGKSDVAVPLDSENHGASPMELVLMGVGGCSAIDIVSILKKQRQQIESYTMEVEGERKDNGQAKPFETIHVYINLEGDIDPAKAKRAAQLSFEKYCSVSLTMRGCVEVNYSLSLNGEKLRV